ncbi:MULTISPECIES: DUF2306 domain-containing protein [unclassified Streptomyces]|uniref:DUF2306 domain-containing protein n=1 Tax=unclassified Streptomyces TaxID=2593676 RepID=UPI001C6129FA|nr:MULTISPECIES: DUF2306 domain-containing protein [unclassified Streptomyces]
MNTTTPKRPRPRRQWTLWSLLAVSAVGIAVFAVRPYLTGDPDVSTIPLNPDYAPHYLSIVVHAIPGSLALLIGPFQFLTGLRVRYPKAHRIAGQVYMACVVVGSAAALFAATFTISGFAAKVAFYIMTAAWLYTLAKAYRTIRRGEVQLHRIWMIRNYALTFAAVTLRLYLGGGLLLQGPFPSLTFDDIYIASVWASFLVNVLVAEYFIVNRTLAPLARRRPRRDASPRPRSTGATGPLVPVRDPIPGNATDGQGRSVETARSAGAETAK